ncbi:indole-3-acetate O-methyltransferase 1 [Andrographis paniculata]|uniref:indole-3-acetate O-methyltransferase 1 n=1 Tax=Andrographis paniculata TaxID=175694 RepID=UPI0021E94891|nr:indole-3-acetate O-methyltransferase 1 [Andrographis paniculata]
MAPMGDNVVVSNMKLERMLSMKGGKGESSYLNNSQAQAQHARSVLHLLRETLDGVRLIGAAEGPFVVADLGCSCGSNTIYMVEVIIKHITERYEAAPGFDPPEFSAFFSDLPSNDFNTLFQLLPPYGGDTMEQCLASDTHRSYFAAGVPGTFYRRLFPANYVDVFYSAFSLHWLSQVPDVVMDKRSKAYNRGRIFIQGANESTANAYKKQFQSDLGGFLRSRSKEIKTGGSMFLVCLGRTSSDPADQGGAGVLFGTHFQDAWNDLVHQGLISSEKRDSFNIPVYAPSLEDFKEVVEADGSFAINRLEVCRGGSPLVVSHPDDAAEVGRALANSCRSVSGVLVDAHIGDQLGDELFSRVASRAAAHAKDLLDQLQFFHIVASLSLP